MTKEKFFEIHKETVQKILKSRSFLRGEILNVIPDNEAKNLLLDSYLREYGNGGQIEKENLNSEFENAFNAELATAKDELTLFPTLFRSLQAELGREKFEKIAGKLDGCELGLAKKIRECSFYFEDIVLLSDDSVKSILKEIDLVDLACALKIANAKTRKKVFSNMSKRATGMLKEDMEFMGPIQKSSVEKCTKKILKTIFALNAAEKIKFEESAK